MSNNKNKGIKPLTDKDHPARASGPSKMDRYIAATPPVPNKSPGDLALANEVIKDLEAKIEDVKKTLREIMHVGRNPACGIAKKALLKLG